MKTSSVPSVPRLESLHHRLKTAKGPDGTPLLLLDELMVFLEDPPMRLWAIGGRRGRSGARRRASATSRQAVWQFYRSPCPAVAVGKGSHFAARSRKKRPPGCLSRRAIWWLFARWKVCRIRTCRPKSWSAWCRTRIAGKNFCSRTENLRINSTPRTALLRQQRADRAEKYARECAAMDQRSEMNEMLLKGSSPWRPNRNPAPFPPPPLPFRFIQAHKG